MCRQPVSRPIRCGARFFFFPLSTTTPPTEGAKVLPVAKSTAAFMGSLVERLVFLQSASCLKNTHHQITELLQKYKMRICKRAFPYINKRIIFACVCMLLGALHAVP